MGTATLGVGLPLDDALPVELRHLLDQVVVLEQQRTVGPDGQRVLVARDADAGVIVLEHSHWDGQARTEAP